MNKVFICAERVKKGKRVKRKDWNFKGLRLCYCLEAIEHKSGSILEIGCGTGDMIEAIMHYRPALRAYGCDISNKAVREAKISQNSLYTVGDALNLPYLDGTFDLVVGFDIFEHVSDLGKAISEASRVLKRGGILHAFIPCEANKFALHGSLKGIYNLKRIYGGHIQRLTIPKVIEVFKKHNFEITRRRYSYHLLGQILDTLDFVVRMKRFQKFERTLIFRGVMKILTLLSHLESVILKKWRFTALGLHLTCKKCSNYKFERI